MTLNLLRQRLALFRAAWGGQPAPLSRAVLRDLAGGLPNAPRLHLDLDGLADTGAFSPRAAPVLAGALLLTIAGPRAAWPGGLAAMLASAEAAWEAIGQLAPPAGLRALPAPLVALLAREAGVAAELLAPQKPDQPAPLQLDFSGMGSV